MHKTLGKNFSRRHFAIFSSYSFSQKICFETSYNVQMSYFLNGESCLMNLGRVVSGQVLCGTGCLGGESRQFPDKVFGDSSLTDLKTVPGHFLKTVPRYFCSVKWPVTDNYSFKLVIMGSLTFLKTVHLQMFYIAFTHLIQKRKKYMRVYENIRKFINFASECILEVRKCFQMFINCIVLSRWWYIIIMIHIVRKSANCMC